MRSKGARAPPSQAQTLVIMSQALLAQAMVVHSQSAEARARAQCLMAVSRQPLIRARQISGVISRVPRLTSADDRVTPRNQTLALFIVWLLLYVYPLTIGAAAPSVRQFSCTPRHGHHRQAASRTLARWRAPDPLARPNRGAPPCDGWWRGALAGS
jgi:hypothetical protein